MEGSGAITGKMRRTMQPKNSRQGALKLNRKMHTNLNGDGNPWRAYVSGIGTATQSVTGLMEHEMMEEVEKLKSYVKDSSDFLIKVEGMRMEADEFFFSVDVVQLYPSVPRQGGEEAMIKYLEERTDKTVGTRDLVELEKMALERNEIRFEDRLMVTQIDGTAIGLKLGREYACAFMGEWEKRAMRESQRMGKRIPTRWYRFTDDVFRTWRGTAEEIKEFVRQWINITYEVSRDEVIFLDVRVTCLAGKTKTALYGWVVGDHQSML